MRVPDPASRRPPSVSLRVFRRSMTMGYSMAGILWSLAGTAIATACFWLARTYLDAGQASLLYLPIVIALAIRFGFSSSVVAALLSFLCWNFFFLPPYHTLIVANPRDWLSLIVFLITAVSTAHLASQARFQADAARTREQETLVLYQASEAVSNEIDSARLLPALAERIVALCAASRCLVLRRSLDGSLSVAAEVPGDSLPVAARDMIVEVSRVACEHDQIVGFGAGAPLWAKAITGTTLPGGGLGVYVPLRVGSSLVGAIHAGPRIDGGAFTELDQRMILALANHAAVVIARETLAVEAAQATALREADALKDSLLSMVSHELRTPLAAIKAASSGLRQKRSVWSEEDREDALRTIDQEADRLTVLVSNLLDLSRLEAGAWVPYKDWCDIEEIVGTSLDRLKEADAARVQVHIDDSLPLIRVDYVQVALVITNLLENAAKYSPDDRPINLKIGRSPGRGERNDTAWPGDGNAPESGSQPDGACMVVSVRDFGSGIPPEDLEAIFSRFYRSPRHANGSAHGTGLGLALCRAVVEAHGGAIRAGNSEPSGAEFTFWIPMEVNRP